MKRKLTEPEVDANCLTSIEGSIRELREGKPDDKSLKDRHYAVTITELEKVWAYFYTYVYQKNDLTP